MAKKLMFLAVALVAVAMLAVPSLASAGIATDTPPMPERGLQGKGATTDKFFNEYDSTVGGHIRCTGVRVVNKAGTQDSFTCTISDLATWPAGTYTLDANGVYVILGASYVWLSDYDRSRVATSGTLTVTDNGDGTGTLTGKLFY